MSGPHGIWGCYIRASRDFQETERQHKTIKEWATRRGVVISHVFEDRGSRDKSESRPEFQRLLKAVEVGLLRWVVVVDHDRLGTKDHNELFSLIFMLRNHGCELWSAAEDKCLTA